VLILSDAAKPGGPPAHGDGRDCGVARHAATDLAQDAHEQLAFAAREMLDAVDQIEDGGADGVDLPLISLRRP
jgi:hypothetical protein